MITETSTLVDELQLRNFHSFQHRLDNGTSRCTTTGASTTTQELHLWNLAGLLQSLHCGYTSLLHNKKVQAVSMNWIWGTIRKYTLDCWKVSLKDHKDVHDRKDLLHEALLNPVQQEEKFWDRWRILPTPSIPGALRMQS